jgi:hypothetical protein
LRVLCHSVVSDDESMGNNTYVPDVRASSPVPMSPGEDGGVNEKTSEDEYTVFGSAPVSRFSTAKGKLSSVLRRRGSKWVEDEENAASKAVPPLIVPQKIRGQPAVGFPLPCHMIVDVEFQASSQACALGGGEDGWHAQAE